jgi:multidrug efflux pump
MIRYDTTPFIRESINEVFKTLLDSVVLVALVVLVFLQNWRSAIIPLIAVPVGIVGTFAVMLVMGFSLNNLTLFGLVLAIGIVVDDAIVVVESVEHHIEHGLQPRAATLKAMSEVSAPVIAVGLVLSSVFIPCAFISGITGQFFRQFALTIASATVISTFNSLTLSPALAAMLLKPRRKGHYDALPWPAFMIIGAWAGFKYLGPMATEHVRSSMLTAGATPLVTMVDLARNMGVEPGTAAVCAASLLGAIVLLCLSKPLNWVCGAGFELFNRGFQATASGYAKFVGGMLRVFPLVLLTYGGVLGLTYWGFLHTPRGFIPSQDMGYLLVNIQLPDSASLERTQTVIVKMEEIAHKIKGVDATVGVAGQSLLMNAYGSNFGTMFLTLKKFDERTTPDTYYEAIANQLRAQIPRAVTDAEVAIFGPPPVRGVGRAGGFMIMIEDRSDLGPRVLQDYTEQIVAEANKQPELRGNTSVFRANVPQIYLDVDRTACILKGVDLQDAFSTLQVYLGSLYVNDFNLFGRTWQVIAQSEANYRDRKEDISRLRVRNTSGTMVPLGSVAQVSEIDGPLVLTRYNMSSAASINGNAAPGVSSGRAIELMEQIAKDKLPKSMSFEWTELAFLELEAGNTAMVIFAFSIVMVFLVLAAQFESWSMPLAVILSVPLCVSSALIGLNMGKIIEAVPPLFRLFTRYNMVPAGMEINIFTQIGLVVLVGLASKNAILIVEFAKVIHRSGKPIREATLESCRLRLRPIIMTSMAFILGVLPLLNSHGAGAEMRKALGLAVFSGMLGVTIFGVLVTPVFFYLIDTLSESSWFRSKRVRQISQIVLGIVTLSYLWRPSRWKVQAPTGTVSPSVPDDVKSRGHQKGK